MIAKNNFGNITKTFGFKILIICILTLLLLIPINMITEVISERLTYKEEAIDSIISPLGFNTEIEGIVIAIPYLKFYSNSYKKDYIFYTPEEYNISGDVETSVLSRGIFKAPIYNSVLKVDGKFSAYNSEFFNSITESDNTILYDEAVLLVGIRNKKSLLKLPKILLSDNTELIYYDKADSINIKFFHNKFIYKIYKENLINGFNFKTELNIQGGNSINIKALATENNISISSKWKDPSFIGNFLPVEREVSKNGFIAKWFIAGFNTSFSKYFTSDKEYSDNDNIKISFLLLNDNYNKTLRSIKYAILFIFIPFLVLFLCEVISGIRVHPIQYILIGLSNVIFYLLLLAISEHLNFNISYLISTIMVTALTSIYIGYIIKHKKYTIIISVVESLMYIFLFGILQLTDYALLVGTLGLFTIIAFAMYFTRNIDWYADNK